MDKKRLYRELAVLDDKGIKLFERCGYGPAIIDDSDDREILLYLCEQQIAEKGFLDDYSIRSEYYTLYENEIKSEDFEKYRKRASWVWKCKRWCDEMYDYFPKSVLLKLVNKRMRMSESELTEIFRKFPFASFNDWSASGFEIIMFTKAGKNPHAGKRILELYSPSGYLDEAMCDALIVQSNDGRFRVDLIPQNGNFAVN